MENHGVDPDIVVQNLPQDLVAGRDPQLDRGIAQFRLHGERPPIVPVFGPAPDKSRNAFRGELLPTPPGKPGVPPVVPAGPVPAPAPGGQP